MKFSTDVLLISPVVMGLIFSASRIWDALSDPVAGYLSDRTTLKFGRRRTWIIISCIPISIAFFAVFSPPATLQGEDLDRWMMFAILGFYSAMTLFFVPHMALGAELSTNYHERTRLFGVRHIFYTVGSILALASMHYLIQEELRVDGDVRELASNLALWSVLITSLLIILVFLYLISSKEDFFCFGDMESEFKDGLTGIHILKQNGYEEWLHDMEDDDRLRLCGVLQMISELSEELNEE